MTDRDKYLADLQARDVMERLDRIEHNERRILIALQSEQRDVIITELKTYGISVEAAERKLICRIEPPQKSTWMHRIKKKVFR